MHTDPIEGTKVNNIAETTRKKWSDLGSSHDLTSLGIQTGY